MTAQELLQQYGISLAEARQFLIDNIGTPETIYNIAAQYNITFAMLADIYGDDSIDGDAVKSFFSVQGFDTSLDVPTLEDSSQDDIPVNLDSILVLDPNAFGTDNWDQILTEYQSSIENFDWGTFGEELTLMLQTFDWEAWAQNLQEIANTLANDSSWLAGFEDWYEAVAGSDFDATFDRSLWVWDDVDDYLDDLDVYWQDVVANFDFSSIDWSVYADTLAMFGLTANDIQLIVSQLNNIDLSLYADLFASLGFDTTGSSSMPIEPVGVSAEVIVEIA
ncbi:hypothetical protein MAQ5080_00368 [Marinomonas aquimarina]|uniref:Uncharacterized protein n=1 Tax=Marinomonas aquimarina TaxID=295068 RepID=A0A1A8T1H7_9GAMM|nr:hypothetical protein [Marinomonas aquimarina]SBS25797.1 hypothetical protein MAQ5080_00368 [Marinomonas aquimarina]